MNQILGYELILAIIIQFLTEIVTLTAVAVGYTPWYVIDPTTQKILDDGNWMQNCGSTCNGFSFDYSSLL